MNRKWRARLFLSPTLSVIDRVLIAEVVEPGEEQSHSRKRARTRDHAATSRFWYPWPDRIVSEETYRLQCSVNSFFRLVPSTFLCTSRALYFLSGNLIYFSGSSR